MSGASRDPRRGGARWRRHPGHHRKPPSSRRALLRTSQRLPMGELIAGQTTAMVITYNEGPNLRRCLDRLRWAPRILIIDSGSTDETLDIARQYSQVDIVERPFDDFASQCNFGLAQIKTRWVLSLDADYELSEALVA